jgi:hypothetical protein
MKNKTFCLFTEQDMKFSIFYEMQISEPQRSSEAKLFHDCLEQAIFADELGYTCLWEVEHHGLYEYCILRRRRYFFLHAARTKKFAWDTA